MRLSHLARGTHELVGRAPPLVLHGVPPRLAAHPAVQRFDGVVHLLHDSRRELLEVLPAARSWQRLEEGRDALNDETTL